MTTAVDPDNTPIEGTVLTPRQVRILKVAVVVMGLMLLAGLAAVIAGMIYQASKATRKTPPPVPAQAAASAPASGVLADTSVLAVPEGSQVQSMTLDGNRLAVHIGGPQGAEIAIVDLASGKVLSRVKLKPAPKP